MKAIVVSVPAPLSLFDLILILITIFIGFIQNLIGWHKCSRKIILTSFGCQNISESIPTITEFLHINSIFLALFSQFPTAKVLARKDFERTQFC